jgi:phage portal protein BeeE
MLYLKHLYARHLPRHRRRTQKQIQPERYCFCQLLRGLPEQRRRRPPRPTRHPKREIPEAEEKGFAGGSDPLAIYKPTGAKEVDAAKAMANFKNWAFAAVNAIASEVANIQLRLYQVSGEDHEELVDRPLLDILDNPNETMTGIELKYTTMAHLELTGNCYWLLDGANSDMSPPRAIHPLNPGRVRVVVPLGPAKVSTWASS